MGHGTGVMGQGPCMRCRLLKNAGHRQALKALCRITRSAGQGPCSRADCSRRSNNGGLCESEGFIQPSDLVPQLLVRCSRCVQRGSNCGDALFQFANMPLLHLLISSQDLREYPFWVSVVRQDVVFVRLVVILLL